MVSDIVHRMQLTPLRYPRMIYLGGDLQTPPMYGRSYYETACYRFRITKLSSSKWTVESGTGRWNQWLNANSLLNAEFSTRHGALMALESMLNEDSLMEAHIPT